MPFLEVIERYDPEIIRSKFSRISTRDVDSVLKKSRLSENDLITLLSPAASGRIEEMAQLAHNLTVQYFGRTVSLYIPLYISNYCTNGCTYCGFHEGNKIKRRKLTLTEIEREARIISGTGIRHVLVLTGEAENITPLSYIIDAVEVLKKYFSSVSIEMFPMTTDQYRELRKAGVDGLTVYQEVYDREIYAEVHPSGKKSDYKYRLNTPERGAQAGLRTVNIGALFGLGDIASEAFFMGLHAKYLDDKFPDTEISVSFPRINPAENDFEQKYVMNDRTFVQYMTALRIFLPRVGINVSTRENAQFRQNILPLGVTKFSAGSRTEVGGYGEHDDSDIPQFEISDKREAKETIEAIKKAGYQPVFKDWDIL